MPASPQTHDGDQLGEIQRLLEHFEQLELQFRQVREGLTHSHRLTTLGTIASIVAHEYNNILTPMINYCQLALAEPADAALMRKAVQKSLDGAERAAKISSSLLGFASDADERHAANLPGTIADALACLAREPAKDGIELTVDVPEVLVAISHVNLQQIMLNLLLNARKAMGRRGGSLRVTGHLEGPMVHLSVADSGPGIPEPILDRLFEPFVTHRIDSNAESPERRGTGLGLCICRELVRSAGGTIGVQSVAEQGATFHIALPLAADLFEST